MRYKAFISYSHSDRDWSAWLQRSLEGYRVPKRLVGSKGEFGPVPQRLTPIFRDREDLPSASDLTSKVGKELESSEALIVICSPAAARSKWVNEEIRLFRRQGREDRIFALIVDGDPQPQDPDQQCFPSALLVNADGSPCEPLAADARKWADGKLLAKLKIVSGILGIRLDELRRRNMQRSRRNRTIAGVSALAMIVLTATLVFTTLSSQKAARLQRTNTEELLSYMLGNLKRLDPIVGLEVLDREDAEHQAYVRSLGFDQMDNTQLIEKGMALREEGLDDHDRGQLKEALGHFSQSRAAFVELHQREGSTRQALFELGQAEFWVGYVYLDMGKLDEAEERFTRYGVISRRLVDAYPNDAAMVMELAYTLTNLGAVERARTNPDSDRALRLTQSALQYNQVALVLDPGNDSYREGLAAKLAFMADAWMESCDLGKAIDFRQQNVDIAREFYQRSPQNTDLMLELAFSLSGLAAVQRRIPITDQALDNLRYSRDLLLEAYEADNQNPVFRLRAMMRDLRILKIRVWEESPEDIWQEMIAFTQEMERIESSASLPEFGMNIEYALFFYDVSLVASELNKPQEAEWYLTESMDRLAALVKEQPDYRSARNMLAKVWIEYWFRHGKLPGEEAANLLQDYLVDPEEATSCDDASLAARLEIMRGNKTLAKNYTSYLLGKGFFEPEFVAFCKKHALCDY
ncbi:MAG: TIR domain-containing protein [Xanthomonadales bacterium]|jgi:tetratricopeptide (TPR) repeat protein|nr:TIR domain-containing protein [Xanthomonadales bacterium]MDH3940073.1 TIR domain-containing protein [Xanthomonadales bacterium]MDH4000644.1 TIR domain-containing protein [Xanthomonadales bacterium]